MKLEKHALKMLIAVGIAKITIYLETSGGQSSNLFYNVIFFNASVIRQAA